MSTSTPDTSAVPIELRLRALEAAVLGVPRSQLTPLDQRVARASKPKLARSRSKSKRKGGEADEDEAAAPQPLARRVSALAEALEAVVDQSPVLKQFYDNCSRLSHLRNALFIVNKPDDAYAPLLKLTDPDPTPNQPTTSTSGLPGGTSTPTPEPLSTRDLLPESAKIAMVLEAKEDIIEAERGLREIDVLAKRDVAGAGDLEQITALKPALQKGVEQLGRRKKTLAENRAAVAGLVERYTEFTSTVSDMFVALHDQVSVLEEAVARAERAKKNSIAQRY